MNDNHKGAFPTILFFLFFLSAWCTSGQHSLMKYDYPVNTNEYDEISPVFSFDEDVLFYTRIGSPDFDKTLYIEGRDMYAEHPQEEYAKILKKVYSQIASKSIENVESSGFNQDIWVLYVDSVLKPLDLAHPGHPLNNALPNSICARYDDHNRFILVNRFEKEGGLDNGFSVSQMKRDSFSFPEALQIDNFLIQSLQVNITSSRDQKTLILALPNGEGDMDLYISERLLYMHYSEPVPITGINTEFDEMTPFLSDDGKTLYFASNRPQSLGGTDIFYATSIDGSYRHWHQVSHFHPPLNSAFDEMYPTLTKNGNLCVFSTNRDGSFDMYHATLARDEVISIQIDIITLNGQSGEKMPAELYWEYAYEEDSASKNYFRLRDGKHTLHIKKNVPLKIRAENRNFKSREFIVDPQEIKTDSSGRMLLTLSLWPDMKSGEMNIKPKLLDIPMERVLKPKEETQIFESAVFQNLMFEKSTANLLDQSLPTIYKLGKYLKNNSGINIEIEGHTDNVGNPDDLLKLSIDRARAIKDKLVSQGIEAERINAIGSGSNKPITDNSDEAKRKINRRVEIRITEPGDLPK